MRVLCFCTCSYCYSKGRSVSVFSSIFPLDCLYSRQLQNIQIKTQTVYTILLTLQFHSVFFTFLYLNFYFICYLFFYQRLKWLPRHSLFTLESSAGIYFRPQRPPRKVEKHLEAGQGKAECDLHGTGA